MVYGGTEVTAEKMAKLGVTGEKTAKQNQRTRKRIEASSHGCEESGVMDRQGRLRLTVRFCATASSGPTALDRIPCTAHSLHAHI